MGLHGLIDGGYTDDTGLANAVATGAKEVVVLLDSNSSISSFHIELLSKDGPAPSIPDGLQSPIFETPAATVRRQWQNFHSMSVPNTTFLKHLVVGSLELSTTNNSYYGISAGSSITVHIVQLCADVTIGFFEDVANYNIYTQEVIQTLLAEDNAAFVKSTLLPMFMGIDVDMQIV